VAMLDFVWVVVSVLVPSPEKVIDFVDVKVPDPVVVLATPHVPATG
jgi:hypothetical protein